MVYLSFDNGVSGSMSVYYKDRFYFYKIPSKKCLDFTKKKKFINRLDIKGIDNILRNEIRIFDSNDKIYAILERPFVNPLMFNATLSAIRAYELLITYLELNNIAYEVMDSKIWQRKLLPQGLKGSKELKKASLEVGNRLYPEFKENKFKDRDSLLMLTFFLEKKEINKNG